MNRRGTLEKPYYAVIFTSVRTEIDDGYGEMAQEMVRLASLQKGFLGVESAREEIGITVSYWRTLEDIENWRTNARHLFAQQKGRESWYQDFTTRICLVEREYSF